MKTVFTGWRTVTPGKGEKIMLALGYSLWLTMHRGDRSGCGYGTSTRSDHADRRTLGDLMADAFHMATFYLSDRGDGAYTHVDVRVEEHCSSCEGRGTVGCGLRRKPVKCKACKGDGARREVLATTWRAYDNGGRDFVTCVMQERKGPTMPTEGEWVQS